MTPPTPAELDGLRLIVLVLRGGATRRLRQRLLREWAVACEGLKWLEREAL